MQNATAAGASPRTPGAYSAPSDPLAGTKGAQNKFAALRGERGEGVVGMEREREKREGRRREAKGREVGTGPPIS